MNYPNTVTRTLDGRVRIVINRIEQYVTEPAFIALMEQAYRVMQSIARQRTGEDS